MATNVADDQNSPAQVRRSNSYRAALCKSGVPVHYIEELDLMLTKESSKREEEKQQQQQHEPDRPKNRRERMIEKAQSRRKIHNLEPQNISQESDLIIEKESRFHRFCCRYLCCCYCFRNCK